MNGRLFSIHSNGQNGPIRQMYSVQMKSRQMVNLDGIHETGYKWDEGSAIWSKLAAIFQFPDFRNKFPQ